MTQSQGQEPNKNEEPTAADQAAEEQVTDTAAAPVPAEDRTESAAMAAEPTEAPVLPTDETTDEAAVADEAPAAEEEAVADEEPQPAAEHAKIEDGPDAAPEVSEAGTETPAAVTDASEASQDGQESLVAETPRANAVAESAPAAEASVDATPDAEVSTEAPSGVDETEPSAEAKDTDASTGDEPAPDAVPHGTVKAVPAPQDRPTPRPPKGGRPPLPKKPAGKPAVVPPAPPVDPHAAAEAAAWGRVDEEGNVYLRASGDEGERLVGQYAIGDSKDDALSMYVRRYLDLVAQTSLLESRLEIVNPQEILPGLKSLEDALVEPAVVGDVDALRKRTEVIRERLKVRQAEFEEERRIAKIQALAERTAIIERAEAIAAQDPEKTHWRDSRNELTGLLDSWKTAQKIGPRIDRPSEESLWKRFSRARTEFDRHRRQFFSQVEAKRVEVTAKKEALIKRAEEMSTSTDWGATSAAYRDLLDEWKAAGRITRKEDDKLWARFRAAQQVFFDARQADRDSMSTEQNANLQTKLELLKEAEAILPIKDIQVAKKKLHDIQDRWEQVGYVPRKDIGRTEGRLRDIESAVRSAEDEQWRKSDPAKAERASGFAAQLEEAIAKLEAELEDAKATGDENTIKRAQEALDARRAWLDQLN